MAASLLVYPTDRPAYGRLCRLLSLGKRRGGKAKCLLGWEDVAQYGEGLIAVLVPDEPDATCAARLRRMADIFGDRAHLALTLRRRPRDQLGCTSWRPWPPRRGVRTVVTNDVLFHVPGRRILQDVVTCIRHGCTIDELGFRRERHADRYLKPPGRDAAPVRPLPGGIGAHARDRRPLPLLARRSWPTSIRPRSRSPA